MNILSKLVIRIFSSRFFRDRGFWTYYQINNDWSIMWTIVMYNNTRVLKIRYFI